MPREHITTIDGSAALLLPEGALKSLGVSVGDEVEIDIVEGKLILRSLDEWEREQKLRAVTDEVFARRQSAYQRLAEGSTKKC